MPNTSIYKSPFNCFIKLQGRKTPLQCHRDYIVKHSKNIIDLIEVGDYVNGKKIEAILEPSIKVENVAEKILCFETDFPIEQGLRCYHDCDIKSIVTKEQFASMEYRLEG